MKSVLLSALFVALLLVSLGPDGSDCIDAGSNKRSEVNSNRQKAKNSLEIFWYPYDRTSKVLLVSLYIIMTKFYFFYRNHAFIYILLFPEKSDQLSTKFVRSCTEIGLLPGDGAERRLRANRKQAQEFIVLKSSLYREQRLIQR